jgi:protein TonB
MTAIEDEPRFRRTAAPPTVAPSLRMLAGGVVLVLHVGAGWALLQFETGKRLLDEVKPLFVRIVEAPPPPPPPPQAPKPKAAPSPQPQKIAAPPPPILATESAAPVANETPMVQTPAPPPPAAPVAAAPAPPAPRPEPVVPPSFHAAYLDNPAPAYPLASRRLGEQGRVLLRVHVGADGLPTKVEVNQSSGFPRLDEVARETVQRWRFVAARRGTEAVSAWVLVPISFQLGG